jgi:hypothetical protein
MAAHRFAGCLGLHRLEEADPVTMAGVFNDEIQITYADKKYGVDFEPFRLLNVFIKGVFVKNDVPDGSFEVPVTPAEDLVDPFQGNGVLYIAAVKFFDGNKALLDQPFEDGIGHSQGSACDTGKIPLMEQISARAVNVFKDDKFGIGEEFVHKKIKIYLFRLNFRKIGETPGGGRGK